MTHLSRWLEEATRGLPPSAAVRVREELAAHVEDAAEALIRQGNSPTEAYSRALAALGDPQQVAYGFNNVYLGPRVYKAAFFACLVAFLMGFGFSWVREAADMAEYSTTSRWFYVIDHTALVALTVFIVISLRRLLVWHFKNQGIDGPMNLILGGAGLYFGGNIFLELTIDSWDPLPTTFDASSPVEGLCLAIMHGGLLVIWVGMVLFGYRALATRSKLLRSSAMIAIIQGTLSIIALVLVYLDSEWSYLFGETSLLFSLFLWPMISLVFFQMSYVSHRRPVRTA
jgi:hypothetical protein